MCFKTGMIKLIMEVNIKFVKTLCLLFTILLAGCSASSGEVAFDFMGYIKNGQHLEMQDSLSTQSHQMMAMFYGSINDKALKPYYRSGQVTEFQLNKLAETDESSRFKVQVHTSSGQLFTDTLDLVKEGGEWKVSKF